VAVVASIVEIEWDAADETETTEVKAFKWAIEIGGRCIKYIVSERRQADVRGLAPRQSNHRVLLQKNLWARLGVQRSKSQARNGSFWIRRGSGWRGRDFIGTAAEAKGGVTTALGKQAQIVQRSSHDSLNSPLPLSMFSVIIFQLEHWNRALSTGLCLTWLEWKWKTVVTLSVPHLCLVYFALTICYPPFTSSHWSLIPTVVVSCPVVSTLSISRRYNWSRIFPQVPSSDAKRNRRPTWADHRSWLYAMVSRIPRGGRKTNAKKSFMVMFRPSGGWMTPGLNQPWMDSQEPSSGPYCTLH